MHPAFPYRIDRHGRTAGVSHERHVRNLIEQVLFTAPGERVNRPTFGSGLLQLVFAPGGDAMAAATQMAVQAALDQWLSDEIGVQDATVDAEDATLRVTVRYVLRATGESTVETFERTV